MVSNLQGTAAVASARRRHTVVSTARPVMAVIAAQQILALHLALETGYVTVAEIFAELLHLLQLQKVNSQHLDGLDHLRLQKKKAVGYLPK